MATAAGRLQQPQTNIAGKIGFLVLYILLIVVAAFQLFPLVWLLFFSLKNNQEIFNLPPLSLPTNPRWANYSKVWNVGDIDLYFFNSVWITVAATALTVLFGSLVTF